jgi:hypothetical protein
MSVNTYPTPEKCNDVQQGAMKNEAERAYASFQKRFTKVDRIWVVCRNKYLYINEL